MQIQHYNPDDIPALIKYQILSFMRTEWPQGFQGRWRGRRWISQPNFHPAHFVMTDDDFVVGHAEALWRDWQHNDMTYRVYGLSAIFVYPDYQGNGYGSELVRTATEYCASQSEVDLGMLWCEHRLKPFYVHCGWQPMNRTTTLIGDTPDSAAPHDDELLLMRFFSEKAKNHRNDFIDSNVYFGWTTW